MRPAPGSRDRRDSDVAGGIVGSGLSGRSLSPNAMVARMMRFRAAAPFSLVESARVARRT
jgi:hypothetical protein